MEMNDRAGSISAGAAQRDFQIARSGRGLSPSRSPGKSDLEWKEVLSPYLGYSGLLGYWVIGFIGLSGLLGYWVHRVNRVIGLSGQPKQPE